MEICPEYHLIRITMVGEGEKKSGERMFARNYNAPCLYFYPIRAADFILAKASGSLFVVRPRGLHPRISASVRFVKLKYFLNFSIS